MEDSQPHWRRRLGPAVLAGVGAAMLWLSWGRWPDVLVDFGRELYVPWRLVEGEVLYRDIAYFNGPLSPYLNALWFKLFGVGLRTLVWGNVVILAGVVLLVYRLLATAADRLAATVGGLVLLTVFAASQVTQVGNYNWVCPYSHEITHGIALGLLGVFFLSLYATRRRPWQVGACGLALGLTSLTKAEVFLAAAVALVAGLGLMLWAERPSGKRLAGLLALFAAGAVLPPLGAFGLLATALPASGALRGVLGTWPHVLASSVGTELFYKGHMGLLNAAANAALLVKGALVYGVALTAGCVAAIGLARRRLPPRGSAAAAFVVTTALLVGLRCPVDLLTRPLPVLLLAAATVPARAYVLEGDRPRRLGSAAWLALVVFGFALLWKIVLRVRFYHYGFALAMPGAVVLIAAGMAWLPAWAARRGGYGGVVRGVVLALAVTVAWAHVTASVARYGQKTVRVGRGADAFLAGERGRSVEACLAAIEERVGEDETLVVLPEGVTLNYLARRDNPTPFINFMPPEVLLFGEDVMVAAFRERPPDAVALVHKSTLEYGLDYFGRGYARDLMAWVRRHYEVVWGVGATPLQGPEFGIQLLRRRTDP